MAWTGWPRHRSHRGRGFFIYAHQLGDVGNISSGNAGPLIAVIAVGICVGFLPHNFYPAKIFMGDSGPCS